MATQRVKRKSTAPQEDDLLAAGAYTLPLESGQLHMTMELLKAHCTLSADELAVVHIIRVKYHSYEQGVVTVLVQMPDRSRYRIQFRVSMSSLTIACRCGETKYRLCVHAYTVLYRTLWLHGHLDLGMYYWPQIDEDDQRQAKFLEVSPRNDRIYVEPRLRFGNLYRPGIGFKGAERLKLTEPNNTKQKVYLKKETVIGYCLAYNYRGFSTSYRPVFIPFIGVTDKSGEEIIRFDTFIREDGDTRKKEVTDAQQTLNRISREQNALVGEFRKLTTEEQSAKRPEISEVLFALWQEALPLLVKEQFVYSYNTHKNDHLGNRLRKSGMERCAFSPVKPVLSFVLKCCLNYYSLTPRVTINGRAVSLQNNPDFFMYDNERKQYHLLGSLQDDQLLTWISESGNKFTVLTDHFYVFKETFLHQVSRCYQVIGNV